MDKKWNPTKNSYSTTGIQIMIFIQHSLIYHMITWDKGIWYSCVHVRNIAGYTIGCKVFVQLLMNDYLLPKAVGIQWCMTIDYDIWILSAQLPSLVRGDHVINECCTIIIIFTWIPIRVYNSSLNFCIDIPWTNACIHTQFCNFILNSYVEIQYLVSGKLYIFIPPWFWLLKGQNHSSLQYYTKLI